MCQGLYPLGVHPHAVVTTRLSKPSVLSTNALVTVCSFSDNINHAFEHPFGWGVGEVFGVFQMFHCGSGSSLRWDMGRYFLGSQLILCKNFGRVLRAGTHLQQGLKWRHLRVIDLPELAKDPEASLLSLCCPCCQCRDWDSQEQAGKLEREVGKVTLTVGQENSCLQVSQASLPALEQHLCSQQRSWMVPASCWDLSHPTQQHPSL